MKKLLLHFLLAFSLLASSAHAADRSLYYVGDNLKISVGASTPGTLGLTISSAGAITVGAGGILNPTVNGVFTLAGTTVATKAYGAAPAGQSTANIFNTTLTGDSGGTTDIRNFTSLITASGTNNYASVLGFNNAVTTSHSAGTVTTSGLFAGTVSNTGNGAVTTIRASDLRSTLVTGSGAVTTHQIYYGKISRTSGTGASTNVSVFYADDSGGVFATNAIGFDAAAMSGAGTLTANFRAANSTGTGRWAFYGAGTAASAFGGSVRVGSVVTPVATLDVTGSIAASTTIAAGTTFQSAAPSGASAGLWKLGSLVTAAVVVDTTRSVFIDIGGTVYKLMVAQ